MRCVRRSTNRWNSDGERFTVFTIVSGRVVDTNFLAIDAFSVVVRLPIRAYSATRKIESVSRPKGTRADARTCADSSKGCRLRRCAGRFLRQISANRGNSPKPAFERETVKKKKNARFKTCRKSVADETTTRTH